MKKLISIGTMFLMSFVSIQANCQDINEIVNKHIAAIGGADNWKKINTMITEMSMNAQGADVKIVVKQVHKKGMRVDIDVMGMHGYQILTNTAGWGFMPFAGQTKAEPLTEEEVKTSQDQLDIMDEFLTYKDYGKKLELIGKDDVEGTECFKITMTDKDGKLSTYYLDASNYFIIKEVEKKTMNGKEFESTTTYSNYKKVESAGIVVAMSQSGPQGEMETSNVIVNDKVDEALFKPSIEPEAKK